QSAIRASAWRCQDRSGVVEACVPRTGKRRILMDEADEIRCREPVARLPYPDRDSAPEPVREALAGLPPLNIFRMLAHAESALRPFLRFGGAILGRLELDPKLRELAILQVAAM